MFEAVVMVMINNGNRTEWSPIKSVIICVIINTIILLTHYPFCDWPKAYSEFFKSVPGKSSSNRLYNNHVKDPQGHG